MHVGASGLLPGGFVSVEVSACGFSQADGRVSPALILEYKLQMQVPGSTQLAAGEKHLAHGPASTSSYNTAMLDQVS